MVSIPKIVGLMSCGFVLCFSLSHVAPASAADDMKAGQTDRKGGQGGGKGDKDKMKGDEMKAGQSPRKGGQGGGKGDEAKPKEDERNAEQSSDKRNDKGQEEMGDKMKGGH